ncbi:MAG: hypothetical protein JWM51_589, partial [Microbacteriaceae bacterium]|nr:hypothetical protein [Microbacteriaceae bacterium]
PEANRAIFDEAVADVSSTYRETSIEEAVDNKEFLEKNGVKFFEIDLDEWREPVSGLVEKSDPKVRDWAERILALRE